MITERRGGRDNGPFWLAIASCLSRGHKPLGFHDSNEVIDIQGLAVFFTAELACLLQGSALRKIIKHFNGLRRDCKKCPILRVANEDIFAIWLARESSNRNYRI